MAKSLSGYVFLVNSLRIDYFKKMCGSILKFASHRSEDESAIRSHVLSSETGIWIGRLQGFMETEKGFCVNGNCKG